MAYMSEKTRKLYKSSWIAFGFRILVLIAVVLVAYLCPNELEMLEGMNFFRHFSVLHLLWVLWVWYMIEKLLPLKNTKPRGCMKYMQSEFLPTEEFARYKQGQNPEFKDGFQKEKRRYEKGAWIVLAAWLLVAVVIAILKKWHVLGSRELLIGSALFYVGDLVCILIWCPFRDVLMKNRCCTQCRIYNWDTVLLILPIVFIPGFFSYSLLLGACIVVGIWEITHLMYPERFFPISNANLQCRNCRGELGCIQYRRGNDRKHTGKCRRNGGKH